MTLQEIDALMLMGKSTRMRDKPFTLVGGRELFRYGYETLKGIFNRVYIVCAEGLEGRLAGYPDLSVVTEDYDIGPLGGIYAGAKHSSAEFIFVAGCDMPLLNREVIRFMSSQAERDGIVAVNEEGLFEPLHAIYRRRRILELFNPETLGKDRRLSKMIGSMDVKRIFAEELKRYERELLTFKNINTPEGVAWFEGFLERQ